VSSDGQSVPFGKNWVHEVQQALEQCDLMFICLTPASLISQWIFFEAGFAYSKGIEVVPVGILGVDLNHVKAPLNLLQGFNVTSFQGLNNFIAVINKSLGHDHDESFAERDWDDAIGDSSNSPISMFGAHAALIDDLAVKCWHVIDGPSFSVRLAQIANLLDASGLTYAHSGRVVTTSGGLTLVDKEYDTYILVEPNVFGPALPLAFEIAELIETREPPRLEIRFVPAVEGEDRSHKITGLLAGTGVSVVDVDVTGETELLWEDVPFVVMRESVKGQDARWILSIADGVAHTELTQVAQLTRLLFEKRVLWVNRGVS
jgi:hypothetical protein